MAVIIFCAKFMGLFREVLIASIYGQGYVSDVLNTATQIPLLFFDMTLGVAILSTFVPIFNSYLEKDGKERATAFANSFMMAVILISSVFACLGMLFANPIIRTMAPGYDEVKVIETAKLLRILFPSIIFTAAAYTSVGILQSFGEFNIPSIISVVSNLIMILYLIVFGDRFGLLGVALSMFVAWAAQLFVQMPSLIKFGYKFKIKLSFKDEGLLSVAKLAVPILISSWVQPLCVVINMAFGSSLHDGAVSGLNWANKIYIIMVGVFAYAVTNFIFPKLSRLSAGGSDSEFASTTRLSVSWMTAIIGYVSAMFIALSTPIIRLIFERGEFTSSDTMLTASALFYYSIGMIGYAVCEILNKSFYAIQDGKTPMMTSIFGIITNFVSAFLLVKGLHMGVRGLALSSAISSIVMAFILVFMMNKRKKRTFNKGFLINTIKTIFSSLLALFTAWAIYQKTSSFPQGIWGLCLQLFVSAIPALLVYCASLAALRTDEFKQLRRFLHEK